MATEQSDAQGDFERLDGAENGPKTTPETTPENPAPAVAPSAPPAEPRRRDKQRRTATGQFAPGNTSRLVHGGRAERYLVVGRLPSYIGKSISRLRAALEAAVLDSGQPLGPLQSALIQSACRHEARALLLSRYLRDASDDAKDVTTGRSTTVDGSTTKVGTKRREGLGILERADLLDRIGRATDQRDKCLEKLRLAAPTPEDALAAWYRTPLTLSGPSDQPAGQPTDAAGGGVARHGGGA